MDKYIYDQEKGYLAGLPARDIDVDEWKLLPKELTKAALKLGMYKTVPKEEPYKWQKSKEVKDA